MRNIKKKHSIHREKNNLHMQERKKERKKEREREKERERAIFKHRKKDTYIETLEEKHKKR